MRSFVAFACMMLVAGSAQAGAPASVNGSWAGEMRQIDPAPETRYPMTLTLKGATGATSYPTLKCRGALTRIAVKGGYSIYHEKVTNEPGVSCIDGFVAVTVDRGKLVLGWFAAFEGEPSLSSATLERAAK